MTGLFARYNIITSCFQLPNLIKVVKSIAAEIRYTPDTTTNQVQGNTLHPLRTWLVHSGRPHGYIRFEERSKRYSVLCSAQTTLVMSITVHDWHSYSYMLRTVLEH